MSYQTETIEALMEARNNDISQKISLQDQLVLIFQIMSGETTPLEHQGIIGFITQIYESYKAEVELVMQKTDEQLEQYQIPSTFIIQ